MLFCPNDIFAFASFYFFGILTPSNCRHFACAERKKTVRGSQWGDISRVCLVQTVSLRVFIYARCVSVCANLMPTQCVGGQPQMTVRAGVCLVEHVLTPWPPAGSLAAPQRVTSRVGGTSHAKVRSRVCLVAHFLVTRGRR